MYSSSPSITENSTRAPVDAGVSVVICCHNSSLRLAPTLEHLRHQDVPSNIAWEVIVVDNASIDDTAVVAASVWGHRDGVEFRIVDEPTPGLMHARDRGLKTARFEFISFVDDDNWVCADWVRVAYETMMASPRVAALGSVNTAAFEDTPPEWFHRYAGYFAVHDGQPAADLRCVTGAGITLRRTAWRSLYKMGFRSSVMGRTGTVLASGEEVELCFALYLAGWDLQVEPNLTLTHFMPEGRLQWTYLRRLVRDSAASTVLLDAYFALDTPAPTLWRRWLREFWPWHAGASILRLCLSARLIRAWRAGTLGDPDVLTVEGMIGRIVGLIRVRGNYTKARRQVAAASWRLRPGLYSSRA